MSTSKEIPADLQPSNGSHEKRSLLSWRRTLLQSSDIGVMLPGLK